MVARAEGGPEGKGHGMGRRQGVSVRQRRVSAELRALREKRGLSCREVAAALGCSESKISRMETGERGLYVDDVAAILGALHVPAGYRNELLALVRDGEDRNWHEIHGKLPTNWKELIRFENSAAAIRNYEPLLIPGLAQIPDYARAILHGTNRKLADTDVDSLVAARMTRQVILSRRNAPSVHLLLDEMVLRRPVCERVIMRAQLQQLLNLGQRPNVTVQLVPFTAPVNPGLDGSFVILDFPTEPTVAYMETRATSSFLEEEEHIDGARVAWRDIHAVALSPADSARLIADIVGELTPSEEHAP